MRLQPRDLRALELYHSQCAVYPRRDTILINFLVRLVALCGAKCRMSGAQIPCATRTRVLVSPV